MPCLDAMIKKVISARPDQTVEDVIEIFDTNAIQTVPVVDEDNRVIGVFNFHDLLWQILPSVVTELELDHPRGRYVDLKLDHIDGMSPWVERRLEIMYPKELKDVMRREFGVVHPDTPLREGIRMLVKYGSPLPVVCDEKNHLEGLISYQSAIEALRKLMKEREDNADQQASAGRE